MSGHSKWAQIKHKKAATDAKRGNLFSKLARAVSVAAKEGGGDPATNPKLRLAVERARNFNMPTDNIERALAKASGEGAQVEQVVYGAYGPGGCALVIEAYTDNRNRTVQELKHLLALHGGTLANPGAAAWAFQKNAEGKLEAMMPIELSDEDAQKMAELSDALEDHDDINEVYTSAA